MGVDIAILLRTCDWDALLLADESLDIVQGMIGDTFAQHPVGSIEFQLNAHFAAFHKSAGRSQKLQGKRL